MKKIRSVLLPLLLALALLTGCAVPAPPEPVPEPSAPALVVVTPAPETESPVETEAPAETEMPVASETPVLPEETPSPDPNPSTFQLDEDGEYTNEMDVADYIHAFGHLPPNFITKKQAQDLGWPGGDLWRYAPGKSIGGDRFGNYEGLLPKGRYRECDVNYSGGSRGAERIIYGEDGSIWYTDDHYESFTQLY